MVVIRVDVMIEDAKDDGAQQSKDVTEAEGPAANHHECHKEEDDHEYEHKKHEDKASGKKGGV